MQTRPMLSRGVYVCHVREFWHHNIPTGTPLTAALNAGMVGRNRDSEPIYGILTSLRGVNAVINTAPPHRGKLWRLPLVVSCGVC